MAETAILERSAIVRHGRRLEYFTIAWNGLEGLVAVIAGVVAGSISLVGFGTDSFIEVTSGLTLLWRMSVDTDVPGRERNEKRALKISKLPTILTALKLSAALSTCDSEDSWRAVGVDRMQRSFEPMNVAIPVAATFSYFRQLAARRPLHAAGLREQLYPAARFPLAKSTLQTVASARL